MALISCPYCGKQVSSTAETCPHCNSALTSQYRQAASPVQPVYAAPYRKSGSGKGGIRALSVILGIVLAGAAVLLFSLKPWERSGNDIPAGGPSNVFRDDTTGVRNNGGTGAAAIFLVPVFMRMGVRQVENVPYKWSAEQIHYGSLSEPTVVKRFELKGTYSGEWPGGKPYGTGTFEFEEPYKSDLLITSAIRFTGTRKNGEPCKGELFAAITDPNTGKQSEMMIYSGELKHSKMHGQGTACSADGEIFEGEQRYEIL